MPSTVFPWITNLPDDIGEGTFQEDLTGLPADDYDHPRAHNSIAIRLNPFFNICDRRFAGGAIPDSDGATRGNGTENSAAILAAIAAASAAGGGTVEIPPLPAGKYFRVRSLLTLPSNVTLRGFGWRSALFFDWYDSNPASSEYAAAGGPAGGYINCISSQNVQCKDFQIKGYAPLADLAFLTHDPARGHVGGLLFGDGDQIEVSGVYFTQVPDTNLVMYGVRNGAFHHNLFKNNGRGAIQGASDEGTHKASYNVTIHHNVIYTNADDSIAFSSEASGADAQSYNIDISSNLIMKNGVLGDTGNGIGITSLKNFTISNNIIYDVAQNGIFCAYNAISRGNNGTITGNIINGTGYANPGGVGCGIVINSHDRINISDNVLNSGDQHGISLVSCIEVSISGGTVAGFGDATTTYNGIKIDTCTFVNISNVICVDNSGAGIKNINSSVRIINCTIVNNGNSSSGNTDQQAAGINSSGGTLSIQNCLCQDTRGGSSKQNYGIVSASETYISVIGNDLSSNKTKAWKIAAIPSDLNCYGNKGFNPNQSVGSGTIALALEDVVNDDYGITCDTTSGNVTVTLPTSALVKHKLEFLRNVAGNTITVQRGAAEVIIIPGGLVNSFDLSTTVWSKSIIRQYDGVNWIREVHDP